MTVIFTYFPQNLSDHMPEKSDPIAHNGKQNVLVYRTELTEVTAGCCIGRMAIWPNISK